MSVRYYGDELLRRARAGAMRGVTEAIGLVETRAVQLIMGPPKTGRIYRRRGADHQASAPGEAPASDTGDLVNRRRIDLVPARLAARLVFSAAHAIKLQMGTAKMEPRPWADRALNETEGEVRAAVLANVAEAIR